MTDKAKILTQADIDNWETCENNMANAALMAAAPEMYAILKRLGQLGEDAKTYPMLALEKTLFDIIEEARRILAKARGEAAE